MDLDVIPTGKTTATVILTQDQVDTLRGTPGRSRVPLAITYGAQTYRTSISVYRGEWMMVVNADMRDGGLVPGGTYTAEVAMDTEERTVDVPPDLATAIGSAGVWDRWEALSYTTPEGTRAAGYDCQEARDPGTPHHRDCRGSRGVVPA